MVMIQKMIKNSLHQAFSQTGKAINSVPPSFYIQSRRSSPPLLPALAQPIGCRLYQVSQLMTPQPGKFVHPSYLSAVRVVGGIPAQGTPMTSSEAILCSSFTWPHSPHPLGVEHIVVGLVEVLQIAGAPHAQIVIEHIQEWRLIEGYTLGSIPDVDLIGPVIPELPLVVGIADTLLIQGALDANLSPRLVTIISAMRWYSAALVAIVLGV